MTSFRLIFSGILFFSLAQITLAAPNIVSQNLTGAGSFTPGSTITFSAETRNVGPDAMNTTNSHRLRMIETLPEVGGVYDYVVKGNYLYTYGYITGRQLHIYDISNPENATLVTTYTVPGAPTYSYVYELELYGDYLVLGGNNVSDDAEMAILNIQNPTSPSFVSAVEPPWPPQAVHCDLNDVEGMRVQGNKLYAAGGTGSSKNFCVYDISNPASPVLNSFYQNVGFTGPFDVQGNYAYLLVSPILGTGFQGISVIDISNSSNLTLAGQVSVPYASAAHASHNVEVSGNYLYLGSNGNLGYYDLRIINISNPASPAIVGELDYNTFNANWTSGSGLSLNYPYLYLSNPGGFNGVNVVDVTNPNSPVMKGHVNGPSSDVTGFNSNYVFGSGYAASSLAVYKPYLRARFCIDNPTCATGGSSLKTVDINPLGVNASVSTSTTWVATAGTHTITYCSDIIEQYGFDGVTEANENDNCSSYTFTVSNPLPPTVTFEAQVNGGSWSVADTSVDPGDSVNLRWSSVGATTCTGSGAGFDTGNAISGTDGVTIAAPNNSATFILTCTGTGGSISDNIVISTRQLPNFSQPSISYILSPTFSTTTGAYSSIQINFQTTNDGGSATKVGADYELQFDAGRNGYEVTRTGALGLLAVGGASNRNETISGPISYGNARIRVGVDFSNTVSEVNESDNERILDFLIPPPDPQVSITADKIQLRNGETTTIRWSVVNSYATLSCQVIGPGISLDPSSFNGNQVTQPITAKSEYTFRCIESITGTSWSDTVIVETQGTIEEI